MGAIAAHERHLTELMMNGLRGIAGVEILGDNIIGDRVGVVTFVIPTLHHALVGAILSYEWGIAVRHGCFCAHPLIKALLAVSPEVESFFEAEILEGRRHNVPGAIRASLGIHNTEADVLRLIDAVSQIAAERWQGNYEQDLASGEFVPQNFQFDFQQLPGFRNSESKSLSVSSVAKLKSFQPTIVILSLLVLLGFGLIVAQQIRQTIRPSELNAAQANAALPINSEFVVSQLQPIESMTLMGKITVQCLAAQQTQYNGKRHHNHYDATNGQNSG